MPTQLHLLVVLNLVKDRKSPCKNGQTKPMQNAATIGSRKTGNQCWMGLRSR